MGAEPHFELWLVIGVLAVVVLTFLSYALVELPGRLLLKSVFDDEPTKRMSRAVGSGIWVVIVVIIHAIAS